jgi:metallo-beta-lactamase family protein
MKIHFNGASRTVTGSQYMLEINDRRLLLECGLFQGRRSETYERNQNFQFDPQAIDAVVLSHAHIDHSGNLPNLVKNGYIGPIYATPPTQALCDLMLQDSGYIQEQDARYVNKKRAKNGLPPVEPLYTQADSLMAIDKFRPIEYDQPTEVLPGVVVTLVDAGHILGSAAVVLDITENGTTRRLWFSGDIGRMDLPLLNDPILPEKVDYLIMESTYGDKPHRDPEDAYVEMLKVLKRTFQRGGKVIIPAFAVGRTQELVYNINRMISSGEIPSIPVFVDSPLAVNASDVFRRFPERFDEDAQAFMRLEQHPALNFDNLVYTRSVSESKEINSKKGPLVIISASGMAENGRIRHHLNNTIRDQRNTIMIVSWAAPYTLARQLAEQAKDVRIFGETIRRKAEVATIGGLSAHAGQRQLLGYAESSQASLKHIFLVHGEPRSTNVLIELLKARGMDNLSYPDLFAEVEI